MREVLLSKRIALGRRGEVEAGFVDLGPLDKLPDIGERPFVAVGEQLQDDGPCLADTG
jgi:hypothetical protein